MRSKLAEILATCSLEKKKSARFGPTCQQAAKRLETGVESGEKDMHGDGGVGARWRCRHHPARHQRRTRTRRDAALSRQDKSSAPQSRKTATQSKLKLPSSVSTARQPRDIPPFPTKALSLEDFVGSSLGASGCQW